MIKEYSRGRAVLGYNKIKGLTTLHWVTEVMVKMSRVEKVELPNISVVRKYQSFQNTREKNE